MKKSLRRLSANTFRSLQRCYSSHPHIHSFDHFLSFLSIPLYKNKPLQMHIFLTHVCPRNKLSDCTFFCLLTAEASPCPSPSLPLPCIHLEQAEEKVQGALLFLASVSNHRHSVCEQNSSPSPAPNHSGHPGQAPLLASWSHIRAARKAPSLLPWGPPLCEL